MTSKIRLLDSQTINQIAAGEVVERPSSVVKELVENAIDAGSTRIEVKVSGENNERIQVADNGYGIVAEDLLKAIQRHATSKISRVEDLQTLATLGFRGEALPSIAAVSYLTITSKTNDAVCGYAITIKDGVSSLPTEIGAPNGTVVTVERLFYNTPARKKFLKTPRYEFGLISDLMSKIILSHPQISFTLKHNNNTVLTNPSGSIEQAFANIYGHDTIKQMITLEYTDGIVIHGLISLPALTRANRNGYCFFANNRWVKSKELSAAVDQAYYTLLPKHRYPLIVLFIEINSNCIDVNVHPAKTEIKFKDNQLIQNALTSAISTAMNKREQMVPHLVGLRELPPESIGGKSEVWHMEENKKPIKQIKYDQPLINNLFASKLMAQNSQDQTSTIVSSDKADQPLSGKQLLYSSLSLLGQIEGTYIIATSDDGIYIIDQHAAHERILFEQIQAQVNNVEGNSIQLAVPVNFEVTYKEKLMLIDAILDLRQIGFIIEHFGNNSFVIRATPTWYQGTAPEQLLIDIIEELNQKNINQLRQEEIMLAACKKAVKANQYLSKQDINSLFCSLDKCQNPFTCPHGRPLSIKLTYQEIEKKFLRNSI